MTDRVRVIAIDGPAASGKTTVAQRLAAQLGYLFFDTGVMYRAVTVAALARGIAPSDEAAVTTLAESISIDVRPPSVDDGRMYDVLAEGEDVTWRIRSAEVDRHVSEISAYRGVRQAMTRRQREIGLRGDVVMVGRDIGTVVLPEADLKIYLDASVDARAQRRHRELQERGEPADYDEIRAAMAARDAYDSTRALAPLKPATDAVTLDTTHLTVDEVVARALALASS
ncbi:MAG TPA: (d)CMP kinase [Anaerolineales bacterium]|nr:(d)CMP kinase [Anaerolineales bacterium]